MSAINFSKLSQIFNTTNTQQPRVHHHGKGQTPKTQSASNTTLAKIDAVTKATPKVGSKVNMKA